MKAIFRVIMPLLLIASALLAGCTRVQYSTETEDINAASEAIAAYSLPEAYSDEFTASLFGYQIVSMTGPDASCHIFLVQAPDDADIDAEDLKKRADDLKSPYASGRKSPHELRVVETRPISLRGESATLVVSEGINGDDEPYREVNALFEGRGGPALVNISAPVDLWDWEVVNEFLESIE
jgi:hypothetical protein